MDPFLDEEYWRQLTQDEGDTIQQPRLVRLDRGTHKLQVVIKLGRKLRTIRPKKPGLKIKISVPQSNVNVVEEEVEDSDEEPYRGVLKGVDADTSRTLPEDIDEKRFEDALKRADGRHQVFDSEDGEQEDESTISRIRKIRIASYEIDTWYTAPYPEEYSKHHTLYICEFCLKYMSSEYVASRHRLKCRYKHPPGNEIYRYGQNSIFEVDGKKMPLYCQNLCLLAKMFLDSKTLYYDVEPFMFYVLTENDEYGCHFVGYFSKQKPQVNTMNYNVSCILTLPTAQRKGYGNFLIDFSYLLTRNEGKTGTPEKPLSSLGLASYTNYWKHALCYELKRSVIEGRNEQVSIEMLSRNTGMTIDDVIVGLENLKLLARDPVLGNYGLKIDRQLIERAIDMWRKRSI